MSKSTDITTRLPEILQDVDRPGNFATGRVFRFYSPGLVVEGIGPIALPLLPMQAEVLPEVAKSRKKGNWRPSDSEINGELVTDLLAGIAPIDPESASIVVEWLLNGPESIDIDTVLLPAAIELHKLDGYQESDSMIRLIGVVKQHLRRRIAEALQPPADWSRPAKLSCHCSQCNDLSRFLADAMQSEWRYKAAQAQRSHLESTIQNSSCDIDFHTNVKGRPYTLVCQKNHNSFNARVEQRKHDERDLATLA